MNLASHINTLNSRKTDIEDEIEFESNRPMPNFLKMSALKRKKLIIKEEIAKLAKQKKTA